MKLSLDGPERAAFMRSVGLGSVGATLAPAAMHGVPRFLVGLAMSTVFATVVILDGTKRESILARARFSIKCAYMAIQLCMYMVPGLLCASIFSMGCANWALGFPQAALFSTCLLALCTIVIVVFGRKVRML